MPVILGIKLYFSTNKVILKKLLAKIWHISAWCLVPQEFDRLSAITNSRHPFFSIFLKMCGKTKIQGNHESAFDYYL